MAKLGKFKASGMKEFRDKLKKLQDPDVFVESCAKELAARLLRLVVKRTPVGQYPKGSGKKGGTLRRGWTGEKRASAQGYAESLKVNHFGDTYVIEIVNPVEYASYVEYGHRQEPGRFIPGYWESDRFVYDPDAEGGMVLKKNWVKGRYMLTISTQELEQQAPALLEKKLYKFLKGCFDA